MIASHRAYLYGKSIFYNNLLEPRMINMVSVSYTHLTLPTNREV